VNQFELTETAGVGLACLTAVVTHGGFGYAKDYHVECYLRESLSPRIAAISPQMIHCFIAENRCLACPGLIELHLQETRQ
jgi:alkylation response protein AidB-like acyl-CoA dehydrogenase